LKFSGKILLLSPLPPPVGGIANWTKILLSKLDGSTIVHLNTALKFRSITNKSLFVHIASGVMQSTYILLVLMYRLLFYKIDVVHVCTSGGMAFAKDLVTVIISKIFFKKVVLHIHMGRLPYILQKKRGFEYRTFIIILTIIDRCIVIDQSSFKALENSKYCSNIILLPNFIDLDVVDELLVNGNANWKQNNIINLCFVGHIVATKGIYELLKALTKLNDENIILHLVGPCEEDFKRELSGSYIKSQVVFYGAVNKAKVFEILSSSDAFVFPSYTEGFPNVILEAMSCGIPILSSNVGAIPEILNIDGCNKCGMCYQSKSVSAVEVAIKDFIINRDLYLSYGKNARKRVEMHYSTDIVIAKLLTIWSKL